MKRNALLQISLFIVLFSFTHSLFASNISVSGNIASNSTWVKDTVFVTGDVTVNNGITLTISPGVKVVFQGYYKLDIKGDIQAIGTNLDSIVFIPTNYTTGWKGIRFYQVATTNNTSNLQYCRIEYGKATGTYPENAGGGIGIYGYSKVNLQNCRISFNTATYGGGISCENNSSPSIINCLIANNLASGEGGGMNCYSNSNPTLIGNVIVNNTNTGSLGGGLYFYNSTSVVTNNTIAYNKSMNGGGIYFNTGSAATLTNNIIWGNTSSQGVAVTYGQNIYNQAANATVTINYNNIEGGLAAFGGVAFTGSYTNNINSNPLFYSPTAASGYLNNGVLADYSLNNSSPVISAGILDTSGLNLPLVDISGLSRLLGGRVEMGAYEFVTVACGTIAANQTWSDYIRVKCPIVVSATGVLTISAGTTVEFAAGTSLQVAGRISAIGTVDNRIEFKAFHPTSGWNGIEFNAASYPVIDSSRFVYCTFSNAYANGSVSLDKNGGAFYLSNVTKLLLQNNIFRNNFALTAGGAIYLSSSSPAIVGNLIVNNTASSGSGIYMSTSAPLIANNTIAFNSSGGVYKATGAYSPTIVNNIIYNNTGTQLFNSGGSAIITYNDIQGGYAGTGNINSAPGFKTAPSGTGYLVNISNADFDISSSSLCINAGNPSSSTFNLPLKDLNGKIRSYNAVDIGTYEYVSTSAAACTISSNTIWNTNIVTVGCNVTINSGVTLTIMPGTTVEFQGNYSITSNGKIMALGTSTDSVKFRATTPATGWGGIIITSNSTDSNKFFYCSFTHAKVNNTTSLLALTAALNIVYNNLSLVSNCSFFENTASGSASYGCALYMYNSGSTVQNCSFFTNSTTAKGGAIGIYSGSPIIKGNTIRNNSAQQGGGFSIFMSTGRIFNNFIVNNTATNQGGAIYLYGNNPTFSGNIIANNQSVNGGAISSTGDNTSGFFNNTIANNKATTSGGAVYLSNNADLNIKNCIIYGNQATTSGQQFFISDVASDPKVYYSLIQGNFAAFEGLGAGIEYQGVYSNNQDNDPSFVSGGGLTGTAGNGLTSNFSIQTGSPAINRGTQSTSDLGLANLDIAGNTRIFNGRIDMGAFENQSPITACGTISGVTAWEADTIKVSCDLTIASGAILTIYPGTFVQFTGAYRINVQGSIVAVGTANRPIKFSVSDTTGFGNPALSTGGWKGIWFNSPGASGDSSKFVFCNFMYGKANGASIADQRGGAIYVYNFSKLLISNCKFINNLAKRNGGAIYLESSNPLISNNLFAHNGAFGDTYAQGGAMFLDDVVTSVSNNTFANNYAQYSGGAIGLISCYSVFRNNIIWGNNAGYPYYRNAYMYNGLNDFTNNIAEGGTNGMFWGANINQTNTSGANPSFINPSASAGILNSALSYDYNISTTSAAVNNGTSSGIQNIGNYDLNGSARNVGGTPDIGAYEVQLSSLFVTSQPSDKSVCIGESVSFFIATSVSINYQWQRNGVNIPGANTATLTLSTTTITDTGYYVCVMSNDFGSLISDTAILTLKTSPIVNTQPIASSTCVGQGVSFVVVGSGTEPLSYQWYNNNGSVSGGTNDTFLINSTSSNNISSYYCVISNQCGNVSSLPVALTLNTPISLSAQSSDLTACPSQSETFSVTASGSSPYNYQWYKKNLTPSLSTIGTGTDLNTATTYPSPYGNWFWGARQQFFYKASDVIAAGGSAGIINSMAFNVQTPKGTYLKGYTIKIGTTPTDSISNNIFIDGLQTIYTADSIIDVSGWNTYSFSSPYYWDGSSNLLVEISFNNTSYTQNAVVYQTNTSYASSLCVFADIGGVSSMTTGTKYYQRPNIKLGFITSSPIANATNNILNINGITSNDAGIYYCIVNNSCGSENSNDMTLTVNSIPSITSQPSPASKCVGENVTFSVSASGTSPFTYQWLKGGNAISGATSSTLSLSNVQLTDAASYSCQVTNSCATTTTSTAALTVLSPVTISSQSSNFSVCSASGATFSITATGSNPITYQWYNTAGSIGSATNNTYTINSAVAGNADNYYCIASNTCGSNTSNNIALTVNTAPTISYESGNLTKCTGLSALFSVIANSNLTISYQWYKDGVSISGANSNSYLISPVSTTDAASYKCRVTNTCGYNESSPMVLTVNSPVSFTSQSGDSTKCSGSSTQFKVVATGSAPISYQWYNNSGSISAATSATYSIPSISTSDDGSYYCVASNSCGTTSSTTKTLTVNTPISISQQPQATQICVGQSAVLSVVAAGSQPFTYQWYKDGNIVAGATSNSYLISSAVSGNAGSYKCRVTNYCGFVESNSVALTVNTPLSFTSQSGDSTKCATSSTSMSVVASGTSPISYQWYNNSGTISGAALATYSISNLNSTHSASYYCIATNVCNSLTSTTKVLTVNTAPTITQSPAATQVCVGQTASLNVSAGGTQPLTYQWYKDGNTLSSATSTNLLISPAATSNSGSYKCRVTNSCGFVESSAVVLTVNSLVSIDSQSGDSTKCSGNSSSFAITTSGSSPISYQWYNNSGIISTATSSSYSISSLATSNAGTYYCVASNMCNTVTSASKILTINSAPSISLQPVNVQVCVGQATSLNITATGTQPLTYQWYKDGNILSGATSSSLLISPAAINNSGLYKCRVTNSCGFIETSTATITINSLVSFDSQSGDSTKCSGASTSFVVQASGSSPISYQWYNNNGIISSASLSSLNLSNLSTSNAGSYYCIASNMCNSLSSASKILTVNTAPSITQQSSSSQICAGQSVSISITASGTQPISYQWYKNTIAISGAISNIFTINNASLADSGTYYCKATNDCGFANSTNIQLTIKSPVSIDYQSDDSNRCVGQSVNLQVTASGSSPITYQWYKSNQSIVGATQAIYTLSNLAVSNSGSYYCDITNVCGSVQSTVKNITVFTNPQVNIGNDTTVCQGQIITLSAGAGYSCLWNNGALNPQIYVTTSGTYSVLATNAYGCSANSNTVNITFAAPYAQSQICIVTVDSATGKNVVVWEKTPNVGIANYKIYKESTISGIYNLIGIQPFDSLSAFVDLASNPAVKAERYKISITDTCGNESAMSAPHKTMHLTVNAGPQGAWNLIWDKYEGFTVPTYRIWRADTSLNFVLIDSVQGSLFTYSNQNPPSGGLYYQVEVVKPGGACVATSNAKVNTNYNSSRSNTANNGMIAQQNITVDFFAFPLTGVKPMLVQFYDNSDPSVNAWTWDFGDGNSSHLQNPAHIYDTVGVFTIELYGNTGTLNGYEKKSTYITVLPVGIDENQYKPDLTIAPNPYFNETQIRFTTFRKEEIKIELFNELGIKVADLANGHYQAGTYFVTLDSKELGLSSGIYLVRLTDGKHSINKRIIQTK